jgi:hypothetical protein
MGDSVGQQIVGAGGVIEPPDFQDGFGPNFSQQIPAGEFVDFEMEVEGVRPDEHLSMLRRLMATSA